MCVGGGGGGAVARLGACAGDGGDGDCGDADVGGEGGEEGVVERRVARLCARAGQNGHENGQTDAAGQTPADGSPAPDCSPPPPPARAGRARQPWPCDAISRPRRGSPCDHPARPARPEKGDAWWHRAETAAFRSKKRGEKPVGSLAFRSFIHTHARARAQTRKHAMACRPQMVYSCCAHNSTIKA